MSKGTHRKSSGSVHGGVFGAVVVVALLALLLVGTPVAIVAYGLVTGR